MIVESYIEYFTATPFQHFAKIVPLMQDNTSVMDSCNMSLVEGVNGLVVTYNLPIHSLS